MTYHLTFTFPKEQYSIGKGSNEFSAQDQEGNRFIMTADNKQKGKFSFCKDDNVSVSLHNTMQLKIQKYVISFLTLTVLTI